MSETPISETKRRLLEHLKTRDPTTAGELAGALGLTDVAVRQHLLTLEGHGLVKQAPTRPEGRGRPAVLWSLTDLAESVFPERHAELAVGLIDATRKAVGDDGLIRILNARAEEQYQKYRAVMPPESAPLMDRIMALARARTAEGYMAEVGQTDPNTYYLVEHHCPICEAAQCCRDLCLKELEVFEVVLGPEVFVERVEHLLSGERRCVYRITPISRA